LEFSLAPAFLASTGPDKEGINPYNNLEVVGQTAGPITTISEPNALGYFDAWL
jgi:hypothetical protein